MTCSLTKVVFCVEYFYAKAGYREQLIESLLKLVEPTRSEPGCLQYDLIQDNKDPNLIILLVKFTDKNTMAKHESQDFIKQFAENEMKHYCEKLIWNAGRGIEE